MATRCNSPLCRGIRLITANCHDRFDWEHDSLRSAALEALHLLDSEECSVIGIEQDGERVWTYSANDGGTSCRALQTLAGGKRAKRIIPVAAAK